MLRTVLMFVPEKLFLNDFETLRAVGKKCILCATQTRTNLLETDTTCGS